MTAAQKKAKDNFKKAIAYRKKTGCDLKAAFAHVYGKKVGAVKKKAAPKKKAAKKAAPKKKAAKKAIATKNKIKKVLISQKKRLKHGYTIVPGKVINSVRKKGIGNLPKYKDQDAAREIQLYADNDSQLYFSKKVPILKNLEKKYKKGTFDINKAAKLWRYFIDAAMQKYNKEFGSKGDKWYELLDTSDRQLLALEFAIDTKYEFDLGNFQI